jgi:hypothetical protein
VALKNMQGGEQEEMPLAEVIDYIQQRAQVEEE